MIPVEMPTNDIKHGGSSPAKPHQVSHGPADKGGVKDHAPAARHPAKSHIPDDAPEDKSGEEIAAAASKRVARLLWKALVILCVIAALAGAGALGYLHYRNSTKEAKLKAEIAAAITAHTNQHSQDGKSYDEVALVDWVRRCLATTLSSHDWLNASGLAEASGTTIVSAAEKHCLRQRLTEVATQEVIAQEGARQAGDDQAAIIDIRKQDDLLHFIIAFGRLHGYALPEEFEIFKSDSGLVQSFTTKSPPPPPEAPASWRH